MNYAEVKSLLDAGFSVDEIRSMGFTQNPQNNPQDPAPIEPAQPAPIEPAPPAPTEPAPPAPVEPDPVEEKFNQLTNSIEKLIKTIQVSNLNHSSMDKNTPADIDKQVDSIMAGLIRPEKK